MIDTAAARIQNSRPAAGIGGLAFSVFTIGLIHELNAAIAALHSIVRCVVSTVLVDQDQWRLSNPIAPVSLGCGRVRGLRSPAARI